MQPPARLEGIGHELETIPTPGRPAVEKKSIKHGTVTRVAGWLMVGAALCVLFLVVAGGGFPVSALLAVDRDSALPGGAVPGLSALDLFQLALALFVGLAFRRFLA